MNREGSAERECLATTICKRLWLARAQGHGLAAWAYM